MRQLSPSSRQSKASRPVTDVAKALAESARLSRITDWMRLSRLRVR